MQAIETRFLFLFTGADPNTRWLQGCGVEVDEKGFVTTGHTGGPDSVSRRFALQTSIPGVFAAGDVRSSSVKRVSAAVGEGAVVAEVHAFLSHVAWPAAHQRELVLRLSLPLMLMRHQRHGDFAGRLDASSFTTRGLHQTRNLEISETSTNLCHERRRQKHTYV
jgi:hypothetical protein